MKPCSSLCSEAGEPLAGSAGNPAGWIGMSWPKPLWDPEDALHSRGLPHGLRELVEQAETQGRKLSLRLFQRTPDPGTEWVELVAMRPADGTELRLRDVPAAQVPTRLRNFLEEAPPADSRPAGSAQLFVCTDGRHDRCCAEHGAATYRALQGEIAARSAPVEIAESSHLGGHRFASTCLVLPAAHLYGRLRAEDAPGLMDAVLAERAYLRRYRGRMGLDEARQVAEVFALERHRDADCIEVGSAVAEPGGTRVRVEVSVDCGAETRKLRIRCGMREFPCATKCGAGAPIEPRARWVVLSADSNSSRSRVV